MILKLPFDGFIIVDKPIGYTSADVIRDIKQLIDRQKIGHGGTLDPMANGVLPIGLGKATRLMEYLLDENKEYLATFRLGEITDTYDCTGAIVAKNNYSYITQEIIEKSLPRFTGWIYQKPPKFSALKFKGKRSYDLARAGVEFDLNPRLVKVHSISLERFQPPDVDFRITCSRGFYVRSLANDLGEYIGCGAHVLNLTRLKVGPFKLLNSVTLNQLKRYNFQDLFPQIIKPMDEVVKRLRSLSLNTNQESNFKMGKPVSLFNDSLKFRDDEHLRIYNESCDFFAIGKYNAIKKLLLPFKVFSS